MTRVSSFLAVFFLLFLCLLILSRRTRHAEAVAPLRPGFYAQSCPDAELLARDAVRRAMARDARSAASVMRLQSPVVMGKLNWAQGCDASLLLDDTPTMLGEKLSLSNINSLRSFDVIDEAKEAVERVCPGIVSCADIIVMAARDAVVLSGGPQWKVRLGRKDSLSASQEASDEIMPSPRANASSLINLFQKFNLSVTDMVALSGSHSIGMGRCFSIVFRLYNQSGTGLPDPHIDPRFRRHLDRLCPAAGDGNVTGGLDSTPTKFDNQYFKDLVMEKGFLNSDQTLYSGDGRTREVVKRFSLNQEAFFDAFVEGMLKMGDLQFEQPGEIRRNCRAVNNQPLAQIYNLSRGIKEVKMLQSLLLN
ncbi:Peroxidase 17 [Apostasia shenzhenica]|uniref:Peroxidase n=1 Tax=Apostasia shenzhenica TaxID=1088818 RepID=A0A2I0A0P8_9ASPA|nr:Peroxidase 17 [Apostasia shenzhenica]